jgi:predicted phosphodiesterase
MNNIKFDDNNIALSFGVMSDIHITQRFDVDHCTVLYKNAIDLAYKYSKTGKLDLMFVPGDVVQNIVYENPESYHEIDDFKYLTDKYLDPDTAFVFCTGNHDVGRTRKFEKEFTDAFTATEEDVKRYYKYDVDMDAVYSYSGNRHAVVNGYHFLSVAMNGDYVGYLKPILDELTAKDPLKTVFVAYHYHAAQTVYATFYKGGGLDELRKFLDAYPQVVFFSGHSHNSLLNPRSIWQGTFTAMETASVRFLDDNSLANFSRNIPVNATHGEVFRHASEAQLVEVDKDGNIRFTCYNCFRGDVVAVYTISAPKADGSHLLTYTQDREKSSLPPIFKVKDFSLNMTDTGDIAVSFTQAVHDELVWYYTVSFFDGETKVQSFDFTTRYFDPDGMPERIESVILKDENMPEYDNHKGFGAHKLESGKTYTAKLHAYDVWDHQGEAQTIEFTVTK